MASSRPDYIPGLGGKIRPRRRALDEIGARQRAAEERRKAEAERQQQAATVSQFVVVQ